MIRFKGTMSHLATILVKGLCKGLFIQMSNVGGLGLGGGRVTQLEGGHQTTPGQF